MSDSPQAPARLMKILQIISADGWVAQFTDDQVKPVACWALVEDGIGVRSILGFGFDDGKRAAPFNHMEKFKGFVRL